MTDIVERLRLALSPYKAETRINVIADAADEIERLQNWKAEARSMHALLFEKDSKIERLHSQVADLERALEVACPHCGEKP